MTSASTPPLHADLPVVIEARHVRLSAAHIELLFGAGHALLALAPLPHTGRFASADVVDVRGPAGTLKGVRVLGPATPASRVVLAEGELVRLGIDGAGASCSIDGPKSTLVVGGDAIRRARRVVLTAAAADAAHVGDAGTVDVQVRAERARDLRAVPVDVTSDDVRDGYVAVEILDANGMDVTAATRATVSSRG